MSDFEVEIRVQVHQLTPDEEAWLREDPVDFLTESDLLDDIEFTVTELG